MRSDVPEKLLCPSVFRRHAQLLHDELCASQSEHQKTAWYDSRYGTDLNGPSRIRIREIVELMTSIKEQER
jgi:hypothetical protein